MTTDTSRRSAGAWLFSFCASGFIATVALIVLQAVWPESANRLEQLGQSLMAALVVLFFVRGFIEYKPLRAEIGATVAQHTYTTAKFAAEAKAVGMGTVASEPVPPVAPATIDNEQPHRAAWQAYWIAGLEYADEAGGITFSKMEPFVGNSHSTWRDCMVMPLVRAGYIAPVMPRRETTFEAGWNAAKARWRIEAGILPPAPPYAPPVKFEALAGQGIAETV